MERFVRYRLSSRADADDVLQEIYLTGYRRFGQLKNRASFKAWILSIARNKIADYFRGKAALWQIPIDLLEEKTLTDSRQGPSEVDTVRETLALLGDKDRQILYLYFWKELPQAEIARRLGIPVGTVKSRLHTAKRNFESRYPYRPLRAKGETAMKKLPEILPAYEIDALPAAPFAVKWEELMGWFLVPRLGESVTWGMYDMPSRQVSHVYELKTTGRAMVHGIEGVELTARETGRPARADPLERTFVAQLTDTHCRYLATMRTENGVRNYITFLDTDRFSPVWGFGEDNIGNETNLRARGDIVREGSTVTSADRDFLVDIVGRYAVTIAGKRWDTVCLMIIDSRNCGVISEQFLDAEGRTVLWRRYNRDDWALDRYKTPWSQQLPANDRLTVNGTTYVHWYDCVTDRVL